MNAPTYSLRIVFGPRRGKARPPYERKGLSWQEALDLKTYFLECVPAALAGSMAPENLTQQAWNSGLIAD